MPRQSQKITFVAIAAVGDDGQAVKRVASATRILLEIAARLDCEYEMKASETSADNEAASVDCAKSTSTDFGSGTH